MPGSAHRPSGRMDLRAAVSRRSEARAAVAEVAAVLGHDADLYLVFISDRYDPPAAAAALEHWAGGRVIGCTTPGGIGPNGFVADGFVAVALSAANATVRTVPISPLSDLEAACSVAAPRLADAAAVRSAGSTFALLLVDGLSMAEEELAETLQTSLGDGIPVIGGSAGDDLHFERSLVLVDGRFVPDAATVTFVTTPVPIHPLRVQHHVAGDMVLVVTSATPGERLLHTLNGRPAAQEYARTVGVDEAALGPKVFSAHPLVIRAGSNEWVRSISRRERDGSLRMFCAVERGSALRLARATSPTEAISRAFAAAADDVGTVTGALVFDCVLRRLELESTGAVGDVARLLAEHNAMGCSTFGEQYLGMHVNQTLVGVVFGE